jgi:hypothetical protein
MAESNERLSVGLLGPKNGEIVKLGLGARADDSLSVGSVEGGVVESSATNGPGNIGRCAQQ